MRLVKEVKAYALADGIKVGDLLMLEHTMSCDSFYAKLLEVSSDTITILKMSDCKTKVLTLNECKDYEVKPARMIVDEKSKTVEDIEKTEKENVLDEYERFLRDIFSGKKVNYQV